MKMRGQRQLWLTKKSSDSVGTESAYVPRGSRRAASPFSAKMRPAPRISVGSGIPRSTPSESFELASLATVSSSERGAPAWSSADFSPSLRAARSRIAFSSARSRSRRAAAAAATAGSGDVDADDDDPLKDARRTIRRWASARSCAPGERRPGLSPDCSFARPLSGLGCSPSVKASEKALKSAEKGPAPSAAGAAASDSEE